MGVVNSGFRLGMSTGVNNLWKSSERIAGRGALAACRSRPGGNSLPKCSQVFSVQDSRALRCAVETTALHFALLFELGSIGTIN